MAPNVGPERETITCPNQINKAKQKLNTLKYIFRTVNLSNKTKEILYLLHVRPILTYAIPAFYAHLSTTQINKLKQIQAKAIKAIYHLPVGINHKLLHIISNIEPLETHILRLITKYTTTIDEDFMICWTIKRPTLTTLLLTETDKIDFDSQLDTNRLHVNLTRCKARDLFNVFLDITQL